MLRTGGVSKNPSEVVQVSMEQAAVNDAATRWLADLLASWGVAGDDQYERARWVVRELLGQGLRPVPSPPPLRGRGASRQARERAMADIRDVFTRKCPGCGHAWANHTVPVGCTLGPCRCLLREDVVADLGDTGRSGVSEPVDRPVEPVGHSGHTSGVTGPGAEPEATPPAHPIHDDEA